jgi:glyoxylase-like metal-dependent hydrolase (beta-lactamase superfamily II)
MNEPTAVLRLKVGGAWVTRVVEQYAAGFAPDYLFPDWNPIVRFQLPQLFGPTSYDSADNKLIFSIHCWIIQTASHTILIDTCTGNHKSRPSLPRAHGLETTFLDRLATYVALDDVDFVLCTHLHAHHCGWNTRLVEERWQPTFPNAKYVFSKVEHDHLAGPLGRTGLLNGIYEDSVLPIIESGQALLFEGGVSIVDDLSIHPAPGHSPGQVTVNLRSEGEEAVFCGDVMHQPIQIYRPNWNSRFCQAPEAARSSRRALLEYAADRKATVFTGHFPLSAAGRVGRDADVFTWSYVT